MAAAVLVFWLPQTEDPIDAMWRLRRMRLPDRVILVRHGESEANADASLWRTKPDNMIELSDKGCGQAEAAGQRIRAITGDKPVGFWCSPFERTIQTLRKIREAWADEPEYPSHNPPSRYAGARCGWVYIDPQIREQEFGNMQGDDHKRFRAEQQRVGRFYYRFPTGESGADVFDRVKQWWSETLLTVNEEHLLPPVDTVVVVTHGLTMRLILMQLMHWSPHTFETVWNAGNCSIYVLEKDLSLAGSTPYKLNEDVGDPLESSRKVRVTFKNGTHASLLLKDYLSLPPPRTRQFELSKAMVAEQHGLDKSAIDSIDFYDGKFEHRERLCKMGRGKTFLKRTVSEQGLKPRQSTAAIELHDVRPQ